MRNRESSRLSKEREREDEDDENGTVARKR